MRKRDRHGVSRWESFANPCVKVGTSSPYLPCPVAIIAGATPILHALREQALSCELSTHATVWLLCTTSAASLRAELRFVYTPRALFIIAYVHCHAAVQGRRWRRHLVSHVLAARPVFRLFAGTTLSSSTEGKRVVPSTHDLKPLFSRSRQFRRICPSRSTMVEQDGAAASQASGAASLKRDLRDWMSAFELNVGRGMHAIIAYALFLHFHTCMY